MERGSNSSCAMNIGMLMLVCITCQWLLSACGGASTTTDHLLLKDTVTAIDARSPLAVTAPGMMAISVLRAQTNLSTYPGGSMKLAIATSPFAICSLAVSYGQVAPSKAAGLTPYTADMVGVANWNWQVDTDAHTGTWPITITATLPNGMKTSTQFSVTVTFVPINVIATRTSLTSTARQTMTLTIQTGPSVSCTIALNYGTRVSTRTFTHKVGQDGITTFIWKVERETPPGVYILPISITLVDGEKSSIHVQMTVFKS